MDCVDGILQNYRIDTPDCNVFFDNATYYMNLAYVQLNIQNSNIFNKNKQLVTNSTEINYSATPVYQSLR